jgi:acyl-CoA synthetase (NDP forming)
MPLKAFLEQASVAVIGASSNPAKLGHAVLKNIVEGDYGRKALDWGATEEGLRCFWETLSNAANTNLQLI